MVKKEIPSSDSDSGSESDVPGKPLAASTQKSPPHIATDDEDGSSNESKDYQPASQSSIAAPAHKSVKDTMEKYLNKFPHVRLSSPKYSVDVDLTDPDDEVWIVRCPSSIDAKNALLNAKLNSCNFGEASKIQSPQAKESLEGFVIKNSAQKPVTIMAGTEFKSFVPVGTIQIRDEVEKKEPIPCFVKQEISNEDEIPFPKVIRNRHPLLGLTYQSALKLPKRVKKALSLAQQRADACHLQNSTNMSADAVQNPSVNEVKKQKAVDTELPDDCSTDEVIKMLIKEEIASPPRKKQKKEKIAVEDDLSWLENI